MTLLLIVLAFVACVLLDQWARRLCSHDYQFVRNIYGDEIIEMGCNTRSVWRCTHCKQVLFKPQLHRGGDE